MFLSIDFGERSASGRRLAVGIPDTGKSCRVPSVAGIVATDWSKWRLLFVPKLCRDGPFKCLRAFLLHLLLKNAITCTSCEQKTWLFSVYCCEMQQCREAHLQAGWVL